MKYFVVPKLIPQPTWGGSYIAAYKNLTDQKIVSQKIGQSYELSTDSLLTSEEDFSQIPIEIGDPKTGETVDRIGDFSKTFSLQSLIDKNPAILGKEYLDFYGPKMEILIKFTQAKGNSFQVHVREGGHVGAWKPKPESWYFLEKGRATLGLSSTGANAIDAYKKTCQEIDQFMQSMSEQVKVRALSIGDARVKIQEFLQTHDPFAYVNVVDIPNGTLIDLSAGGIHHSWEEGEQIPQGNIVYEVQRNVMDNECTLRSFDKGKIADDGTIRPVHVEEYFAALDTSASANDVSSLIRQPENNVLFESPYYSSVINPAEQSIDTFFGKQSESFIHRFYTAGQQKGVSEFICKE